jgi:hypothetical protein
MAEVEEVYLPLSRLLNFYVGATAGLHRITTDFLGERPERTPFVIGVAGFLGISRRAAGGLAIESHHAYRATRMVGAYLRGRFTADPDAKVEVAERYGLESEPAGLGLRFEAERATWWRGFTLETADVEQPAAKRVAR